MSLTVTTTRTQQNTDTVGVIHTLAANKRDAGSLLNRVNSVIDRLAAILENFCEEEDDLSLRLFEWGTRTLTLVDLNRLDEEKFKQLVAKHLMPLEEELRITQIQVQAQQMGLPIEVQVHAFAREMYVWFMSVQNLTRSTSTALAARSTQELDLASLPTPVALMMYNMMLEKAKNIEEQRRLQRIIKNQTHHLSDITKSVKEQLKKGKKEIEKNIKEREVRIDQRINTMENRHQVQARVLESRINGADQQLSAARRQLNQSQQVTSQQGEQIRNLILQQQRLKNRVEQLQDEVDDSFCVIL